MFYYDFPIFLRQFSHRGLVGFAESRIKESLKLQNNKENSIEGCSIQAALVNQCSNLVTSF